MGITIQNFSSMNNDGVSKTSNKMKTMMWFSMVSLDIISKCRPMTTKRLSRKPF